MLAGFLIGGLWLVFIMLAVWVWRDGQRHITTLRRAALRKRKADRLRIMIHGVAPGEKPPISSFFGYHWESRRIGRFKKADGKSGEK
ncbi:MAG: hypothetical protein GJU72_08850 [Acidithiobacillus ferriphilus]|jgi:hypothetical protein|nr:hypothetical protein [Acidithiobacillus ferriphilus]